MEHNWLLYIAAFACSFGVSLFMTPVARKLSWKFHAIDYPKDRGLHKEPIPRLGGIAIVTGFMVTMAIVVIFLKELQSLQFMGFIIGAFMIVILGMLDDIYQLGAKTKLFVQVVAAVIVVATGTHMQIDFLPFKELHVIISPVVTVFWIVGVTNAVNLIDGVDGLAAGVSTISAMCLTALCILSGSVAAVVFSATLAGACLGFLPRNFSPAEVIMGDTGATFLGYVLAVTSLIGVFKSYAILSVVIAVLALAFPIFDVLFAMIRRAINHKPIMGADRGHLHHRLIDSGYSHSQTVVILYIISIITATIAIVIALQDMWVTLIVVVSLTILLLMIFVYRKRVSDRLSSKKDENSNKDV